MEQILLYAKSISLRWESNSSAKGPMLQCRRKERKECVVAVRVVPDSSSRLEMGVHTGNAGNGPVGVTSEL